MRSRREKIAGDSLSEADDILTGEQPGRRQIFAAGSQKYGRLLLVIARVTRFAYSCLPKDIEA